MPVIYAVTGVSTHSILTCKSTQFLIWMSLSLARWIPHGRSLIGPALNSNLLTTSGLIKLTTAPEFTNVLGNAFLLIYDVIERDSGIVSRLGTNFVTVSSWTLDQLTETTVAFACISEGFEGQRWGTEDFISLAIIHLTIGMTSSNCLTGRVTCAFKIVSVLNHLCSTIPLISRGNSCNLRFAGTEVVYSYFKSLFKLVCVLWH
jgi:hypothetical protein